MKIKGILFIAIILIVAACGNEDYTPKPRIYPKAELPIKAYKAFDTEFCSFTFQQPEATEIKRKKEFFGNPTVNSCWFDLYYPTLNGSIHFTYYPITKEKPLYEFVKDTYRMEDQHVQKATYMDHAVILKRADHVFGELTDIGGDVGMPFQFFLTDSTTHFVRAGLSFNTAANSDSLAPVIEYVKEDMMKLIESFQWKD
ncbi:MAG: gliding motility-associated lipoprotein GldD [Saprospiraceae bacterium]|jgi:gliding motility-associated lipoprotein GldD